MRSSLLVGTGDAGDQRLYRCAQKHKNTKTQFVQASRMYAYARAKEFLFGVGCSTAQKPGQEDLLVWEISCIFAAEIMETSDTKKEISYTEKFVLL